MNVNISEMSSSLLEHLRNLFTTELHELGRDVKRRQQRLDDSVKKRQVLSESLDGIQTQLDDAKRILDLLNSLNVDAADITRQEAAVDALQKAFDGENAAVGTLTETESIIEQLSINHLSAGKSILEAEIDAIQTEIDSR